MLRTEGEPGCVAPSGNADLANSPGPHLPVIEAPAGVVLDADYLRLQQARYARHLELVFDSLIARNEVIAASHVLMFLLKYSVLSELGRKRLPKESINRRALEQEFLRLHHQWELRMEAQVAAMSDEELAADSAIDDTGTDEEPSETRSMLNMYGLDLNDQVKSTSVEELREAIAELKERLTAEPGDENS
jgi:hypothetical protein